MKKYLVYLLLPLAACTDSGDGTIDDTPKDKYTDYQITGSIHPIHAAARVVDGEVETKFQENDVMLIGWSGAYNGYAYKYGSNETFTPVSGDASALWTGLASAYSNTAIDVYAWYRRSESETAIPVGSSVSVNEDQSTEDKYTANICLAAHTTYDNNTTSLQFGFSHLMARLKLSIDFNDKGISTSDLLNSTVTTQLYTSGTLQASTAEDKKLEIVNVESSNSLKKVTMFTQVSAGSYHLDCTCLLPPQTLTPGATLITITLGSGKEYTCTLGKDLTLKAAEEAKIPINISVGGTSVYAPVVTILPETKTSSYSGNRLITANSDDTISIYEKQADGSWVKTSDVYESDGSTTVLQMSGEYHVRVVDIYGDCAGIGATTSTGAISNTSEIVYFCRRNQSTGKWYLANTMSNTSCYSLVLNADFFVYGGSEGNQKCKAIPINADGTLNTGKVKEDLSFHGFKLCLAENNMLCTGDHLYQLRLDASGFPVISDIPGISGTRSFTDGKRVISQIDKSDPSLKIYNIEKGKYETIKDLVTPTAGRPVVIYDKYALVATKTNVILYYFDEAANQWVALGGTTGDSFLDLMKTYAPSDAINKVEKLDNDPQLMMKGARAVIVSNNVTYFVENIDEIANQYLAEHPLSK